MEWIYFYRPNSTDYLTPSERGLIYEVVHFNSPDGTRLYGWFIPAHGKHRGTVVHFHGNTKNISGHFQYIEWLPANGYDVFLFDYRGFGHSSGFPHPRGIHEDGLAALNYIRNRLGKNDKHLIVFGQSLGANYALSAVAENDHKNICALIIEGGFASHREIAKDKIAGYHLPDDIRNWFINLLITDHYDGVSAIKKLHDVPVLLIHGANDNVVPFRHAKILASAATGTLRLWKIPEGQHLDTFVFRPDKLRQRLLDYIEHETECSALRHANTTDLFHMQHGEILLSINDLLLNPASDQEISSTPVFWTEQKRAVEAGY